MRVYRLIGIIHLLLQNKVMTAPELSERLEVSRRTINRDIEELCKAGVPVVTRRGVGGGIQIAEGFTIDKTILSPRELESIITGLRSLDSILPEPVSIKLMDKLSGEGNRQMMVNHFISIDLVSHYKEHIVDNMEKIRESIMNRKLVQFQYYSIKGNHRVILEPYFLFYKWNSWYLYGYNIDKKSYRLYKFNRLSEFRMLDKNYRPREVQIEDINLDSFFTEEIRLKASFDESEAYRIIDEYGLDSYKKGEDGRLYFERYFTNQDYLIRWLLSFGEKVKVLEPMEIKDMIIQKAEKINHIYK